MDTDSKESSSDDSVGKQLLEEEIKRIEQEIQISNNKIRYLKNAIWEWPVSPIRAPIHEPQDLSEDSFEHLPNSPISLGSLHQSEFIYDPNEALHQASIKESNDISPQKTLDDKTKSAKTGAKFKAPQRFAGSGESCVSKSKESANPKFRYKKGSKHAVRSIKASCQKTTVKPFKEAYGSSELKCMKSQSSEADIIRISTTMKRKVLDSDESCSTRISNISGTCADDNPAIQLSKKLKLHDDEKARIQCPTITSLLSQKKYELSDSSEYIYLSGPDESRNENEQLPSSRGVKKVLNYESSSDESSLFKGNEHFLCSEREESYLTSKKEDMSESRESSSDEPLIDRWEYSLKSASELPELFASDEASASNSEES